MDLERLIERTIAIQSIPAPTFSEGARAAWIHKKFSSLELSPPEQDPIGNVSLKIPGGDHPPLVLTAHLDTVFPSETSLQIQRTAERIYGPGIGDNSLSLAVLLELAEDLAVKELPGDVWLIANVGEEGLGNLLGMRQVVSRFQNSVTGYIVLEGMSLGHIYYKGLSIQRYRISAEGPGGHSWIHNNRPSAIHVLVKISQALLDLELSKQPKSTLNIGLFHGGTTINSIAGKAYLELDLRSETSNELEQLILQTNEVVSTFMLKDIIVNIENIGERPGGSLAVDHPLLEAAKQALKMIGEKEVQLEIGSTDANVPLSLGLPAICVGITRGGGAHSLEEYIEIAPISQGYEALLNTIDLAFQT